MLIYLIGRLRLAFAAIAFAAAAVVCCMTPSYAASPTEPYTIGAVFDVTGPASPLGAPEEATVRMLVRELNDNGGIDGHPVKLVVYDNASDESKSVIAVKRLVESDKVLAIIGPSQTGTTMAAVDIVSTAKVPLVSCAAGVGIVSPVKPFVFKTAQSDVHAAARVLAYLKSQKVKRAAILCVSNAFGESGRDQLRAQATKYGITIAADESFGDKDTDMTPQLLRIRKSDAKAVICWGTNPGPAIIAKNMKTLGMSLSLVMSHGVANRKFIELAGSAAEGVVFPASKLIVVDELPASDAQRKVILEYASAYKKEFGREADSFGGYAHDAFGLVVEAIKRAGANRERIRQALESIKDWVGVSGIFSFSPSDHNGLNQDAFVMVTIKNGDWKLLK